jgi:UDPglucose 6-dehydrogenase
VPTPSLSNGVCDTSVVFDSVEKLSEYNYEGVVVVKSTVTPGTTKDVSNQFPNLKLAFVPEFLRERCAVVDFIQNHDVCVIGTDNEEIFQTIKQAHGHYPKNFIMVSTTEAEIIKYYNNIYNTTLIVLANSFYEVCQSVEADYSKVKKALVLRDHVGDSYLQCNKNFRGFGGVCLPKDTLAIAAMVEEKNLDISFFKMLIEENNKYKTTVYDGMREQ